MRIIQSFNAAIGLALILRKQNLAKVNSLNMCTFF